MFLGSVEAGHRVWGLGTLLQASRQRKRPLGAPHPSLLRGWQRSMTQAGGFGASHTWGSHLASRASALLREAACLSLQTPPLGAHRALVPALRDPCGRGVF